MCGFGKLDPPPALDAIKQMGAEYFVVSSEYPHSDGAFPEAMQQFFGLQLSDDARRKILWDNCARRSNATRLHCEERIDEAIPFG